LIAFDEIGLLLIYCIITIINFLSLRLMPKKIVIAALKVKAKAKAWTFKAKAIN